MRRVAIAGVLRNQTRGACTQMSRRQGFDPRGQREIMDMFYDYIKSKI